MNSRQRRKWKRAIGGNAEMAKFTKRRVLVWPYRGDIKNWLHKYYARFQIEQGE